MPILHRLATVALALLFCCVLAVLAATPSTLPINWAAIPADATASTSGVPRGCTCLSADSPCTAYDCTCVCDLTAGSCDANCCCDSECLDEEVARFRAANECVPEGPLPSTTKFCADLTKEALFGAINPKFRMIVDAQDSVVDDLMCVAVDNNPSKGSFFTDPGAGSVSLLDAATGVYSFKQPARSAVVSTTGFYEVGDNVGAAAEAGGALVTTGGGSLFVPRVADSGACFDSYAVPFAADIAPSTCTRTLAGTTAARCAALDYAGFVANLRVAKAPTSQPGDASTYVPVTVTSVQLRTAAGAVIDHPAPASLSATLSTRSWCYNAVLSVLYTLTHDGAGHVSAASAALVLGNVTVGGDFATVQQSFGVSWQSSATVATSFSAGNAVPRDMSGNPGYISGKPVLAGTLETDAGSGKQAVAAWAAGLLLDDCTGNAAVGVTYGDAMTFGCSVALTLAELEAMCTSKSQLDRFGFAPTHVGVFGNADPLQPTEWLEVTKSLPASLSTVWQASTRSCTGMATGLDVEFLTAQVGEVDNPQDKILAVRSAYATDTWAFTSRTSMQTFVFRTTVSFVPKAATGTTEYLPPGPPILPELPNDLFYPFTLGDDETSAARSVTRSAWRVHVLCAFALAWLVAAAGYSASA